MNLHEPPKGQVISKETTNGRLHTEDSLVSCGLWVCEGRGGGGGGRERRGRKGEVRKGGRDEGGEREVGKGVREG